MSITVVVFEENAAPKNGDWGAWLKTTRATEGDWPNPKTSSNILNSWFSEMRERFPPLVEADPDDPRGTEYSFCRHFVRIELAGSVGDEGVVAAWKIASKLGLRILVGDDLLPPTAPKGRRRLHIAALDGVRARARSAVEANVNVAIVDPTFAPISGTKRWIYDQLNAEPPTGDPSILASDRLRQWNDEFGVLGLAEPLIFKNFVLLRLRPADLDRVAPIVIKLAKRLRLGISIFENQ